jgi:hypothetical protein
VHVASADPELEQEYASPDNFYGILGVPENASRRDIKRAYKAMMKDFHPDLSGDEESTEFCILLNEIYEVRISGLSIIASYVLGRSNLVLCPAGRSAVMPWGIAGCLVPGQHADVNAHLFSWNMRTGAKVVIVCDACSAGFVA